jgi:hypothetical protein
MKKLTNCINYGSNYILVFDPMNLDRAPSREIFKYFKMLIKDKSDMEEEREKLQVVNQQMVN